MTATKIILKTMLWMLVLFASIGALSAFGAIVAGFIAWIML